MKLAVTGANGFLGHHLVDGLRKTHEIHALQRTVPAGPAPSGVTRHATDYSHDALARAFDGCDVVLHLAAQRAYRGQEAAVLANSTLDYTVFAAARDSGVGHVIFVSSRGVYGAEPAPWLEITPTAPTTLYAVVKRQSELTAEFFVRKGLGITTVRLAQAFGLGEYADSAITTFLRQAYRGAPIELRAQGLQREHIYIKDIVSAFAAILAAPQSGIYNVGSGETVALEDMAKAILAAFGRSDDLLRMIAPLTRLTEVSLMDSSRFRADFGWAPAFTFASAARDIAAALADTQVARRYGFSDDQE